MNAMLKGIDRISEWSGKIFMWLIVPLTVLVAFEVIARRVFDAPHIWAPEVTDYIYGTHFMMVAAYTLLYNGHVSIDIIYQRFSPRVRGFLDCFTYLLFFFPFCGILFYQGFIFALTSYQTHETSGSAVLPIVPEVKTVIPVTFALLLLQGLSCFVRSLGMLIKGEEL